MHTDVEDEQVNVSKFDAKFAQSERITNEARERKGNIESWETTIPFSSLHGIQPFG